MQLKIRTTYVCALFILAPTLASGQAPTRSRLSVLPSGTLADSIVEYLAWPNLQAERLSDGRVLIGPMPGNVVVALFNNQLTARVLPLMKKGSGPKESQGSPGSVVLARGPGARSVISSRDPSRTTVLNSAGNIEQELTTIRRPDGAGISGGSVYVTGVHSYGDSVTPGIFRLMKGKQPEMIFSLREGNAARPGQLLSEQMDVLNDRIIAARGNSNTVSASRGGCAGFVNVVVKLPWFERWDRDLHIRQADGPIQSLVEGIRWYDATTAMLLILRARPGSVYPKNSQSGARALPPPRAPSGKSTVTEAEIHIETVLVLFDVNSGNVLDQAILPRRGWSFLSNRELIRKGFNPEDERYEIFTISWMPPPTRSPSP